MSAHTALLAREPSVALERSDDEVTLRPGRPDDASACGHIIYEAFKVIAERHGFPPDFPSAEVGTRLAAYLLAHPQVYSVVAEQNGEIVGSNFLDERTPIAGVGPITIAPWQQDRAVGRRLMIDVIERARATKLPGVRLVQAAYHGRSLSLYAKLGFDVREPLANMYGPPPDVAIPGRAVRPATLADLPACDTLCRRVHGHDRSGELRDAIRDQTATVVEASGRITGYATILGFFGHAVAVANDDLKALIAASTEFAGPGILVPTRNGELFRWCLAHGLRVAQTETLMTVGLYNEPQGAWLPSVIY